MGEQPEFPMPIIIIIAALCALRYFEVWKFADLSWWWIVGLMAFAFAWFEFIEPMLGHDKRKAHNEDEKRRQSRVSKTFNDLKRK
jgi:small Trp-rich protein